LIEKEAIPWVEINGEIHDFREYIKASRVSREVDDTTPVKSELEKFEDYVGTMLVPKSDCLYQQRDVKEPRLITIITTTTVQATSTSTISNVRQTLRFNSEAANPGCFPLGLMNSMSITRCV
jgi:hypothetical protein